MNIILGTCLSKKNYRFLNRFLNSLSSLEIPNNYFLKIVFILEKKNRNFEDIIFKILKNKNFDIIFTDENGIPQSRNMFLKYLKKNKSKYAGFLDDDCSVPNKWLVNMIKFIEKTKCDVAGGPQLHRVKNKLYSKLFNIIEPNRYHEQKVDWIATNNAFFKSKVLANKNLFFDVNLKNIGGSDQLFFKKLYQQNLTFRWNLKSIVIEDIQTERENFKWFLKRNLRYGYSGSYIDKSIYGSKLGITLNIFKALYLLFLSLFFFLLFFLNNYNFYKSIFYFYRSLGRFSSLISYKPKKYI
jgi:hypothetical protein